MPDAMNPPLNQNIPADCVVILIPAAVEKQQNRRILCGFYHVGTKKDHKNRTFERSGCRKDK
jgi:hypothetical protein